MKRIFIVATATALLLPTSVFAQSAVERLAEDILSERQHQKALDILQQTRELTTANPSSASPTSSMDPQILQPPLQQPIPIYLPPVQRGMSPLEALQLLQQIQLQQQQLRLQQLQLQQLQQSR